MSKILCTFALIFLFLILNESKAQILTDGYKNDYPSLLSDTLPADFPNIAVKNVNNPAPGYFFIANPAQISNYGNFCIIVDNEGVTKSFKRTKVRGYDFNMQPNGLFSYADAVLPKGWFWANVLMYVVDDKMAIVDSFQSKNGYQSDMHEFKWLPNGHVYLLSQDPQYVDLSKHFKGGNPNALVAGSIIQELDENRNVVFQWRTWDHLSFDETYEDTLQATVNPFHFNAMDIDKDGNILVSVRHTCQILKISRKTGEIIWRLGGKRNQFQFINEDEPINGAYFSHQHHIKVLPNGNITLYDNGWIRNPQYSRGVEYKIDEVNMTATKVWQYRHTPDIYTDLMGSVQRLSNGNTVICWGGPNPEGRELVTELHPDNSIALEMTLPPLFTSYRVYKHELPACQTTDSVEINEVLKGNTYKFNHNGVETGITITFNELESFIYNNVTVKKNPCASLYPKFDGKSPTIYNGRIVITTREIESSLTEIEFDLSKFPEFDYPSKTIVYKRETIGSGYFIPLETTFNESKNTLKVVAKNFGEFIFGWIDESPLEIIPPTLISPTSSSNFVLNHSIQNKLVWANNGYCEANKIQISDDYKFSDILIETVLNGNSTDLAPFPSMNKYYWRVNSIVGKATSSWSKIDSFWVSVPQISILTPSGAEKINKANSGTYIIRWWDNLEDSVKIELYKDSKYYETITDKFLSHTGAYVWNIDSSIPVDSKYKIRISSIKDDNVSSINLFNFSIIDDNTSVDDLGAGKFEFTIAPNPASNNIEISFQNELQSLGSELKISVYNSLGVEIQSFEGATLSGQNSINLSTTNYPSGVYYCTISSGRNTITKSFVIMK